MGEEEHGDWRIVWLFFLRGAFLKIRVDGAWHRTRSIVGQELLKRKQS